MKKLIYILTLAFIFGCSDSSKTEVINKYSDGSPRTVKEYPDDQDRSKYILKDFFQNGTLAFEGKVKNGKFVEYKRAYYQNGNLKERATLADSADLNYCCPNGFYEVYYDNGQLEETHHKKDGLFNGLVTEYDTAGNKITETQVSADLKNGIAKTFFVNGNVKSIKEFHNDTLVGTAYYFTETGDSLKKHGTHKGNLDFPIKYWKDNGSSLFGEYHNNNYYQVKWTWKDSLENILKTEVADTINGQFVTPDY